MKIKTISIVNYPFDSCFSKVCGTVHSCWISKDKELTISIAGEFAPHMSKYYIRCNFEILNQFYQSLDGIFLVDNENKIKSISFIHDFNNTIIICFDNSNLTLKKNSTDFSCHLIFLK